jgi:LysM repeat protein
LNLLRVLFLLILLAGALQPAAAVRANPPPRLAAPAAQVTAFDLIIAMNTLRTSYGLPALVEDPIINAVAQSTAEIMAANQMSWHIGDVSGRLAAAGYGGGAKVWATENFAVGSSHTIDEIMVVWSDPDHMIPAVNPAYCHVGAGVAKSPNGMTYYVLQAAYTSNKACGEYKPPEGFTPQPGDEGGGTVISQVIVPVKIATPDADGNVYHIVEAGQSFWAIAIAYQITIKDLEIWNNLSKDSKLQIGQRLLIPGPNTKGYATPTPVGMIQVSTPGPDGKVVHTVQSYQTLSTIAAAYKIGIEAILALNGLQVDWPLQIGQKLVIKPSNVTPSPTPRPLTPVEKLTPASDGRYYHTIQSGETLSWVADLYEVNVFDLMGWNGLNETSIIQPGQKLLLQVTPPATATWTPAPPTATSTETQAPPTSTATLAAKQSASSPTAVVAAASTASSGGLVWVAVIGLLAGGVLLIALFFRNKG